MKILLELRNRENEFVGAGYINDETLFLSYDSLKSELNSSMIEYNWEEDQSLKNCVNILSTVFLNLNQNIKDFGIVFKHNNVKSFKAFELLKNNEYKTKNFLENLSIFFKKDWMEEFIQSLDMYITIAAAEPETIY